jgi:hypothetical protein
VGCRRKGIIPVIFQPRDWKILAKQASKEMDPDRLMNLVDELNRVLEQNERTSQRLQAGLTQRPAPQMLAASII